MAHCPLQFVSDILKRNDHSIAMTRRMKPLDPLLYEPQDQFPDLLFECFVFFQPKIDQGDGEIRKHIIDAQGLKRRLHEFRKQSFEGRFPTFFVIHNLSSVKCMCGGYSYNNEPQP